MVVMGVPTLGAITPTDSYGTRPRRAGARRRFPRPTIGNTRLESEGKADKVGGKLEQGLEDAKDKGEELVDKVKDKV
jgi:hypothetical protein